MLILFILSLYIYLKTFSLFEFSYAYEVHGTYLCTYIDMIFIP